jgi:hypothetical protein
MSLDTYMGKPQFDAETDELGTRIFAIAVHVRDTHPAPSGHEQFTYMVRQKMREDGVLAEICDNPKWDPLVDSLYSHVGGGSPVYYPQRHLNARQLLTMKQQYVNTVDNDQSFLGMQIHEGMQSVGEEYKTSMLLSLAEAWKTTTMGMGVADKVSLIQQTMADTPIIPMEICDLPFVNGFIHLEQPMMMESPGNGARVPVRGMSWHSVSGEGVEESRVGWLDINRPDHLHPAVMLTLYRDPREFVVPTDIAVSSRFSFEPTAYMDWLVAGTDWREYGPWSEFNNVGEMVPFWSVLYFLDLTEQKMKEEYNEEVSIPVRAFHTVWGLMDEQVIEQYTLTPPRAVRRAADRDGITSDTVVLRLRRVYNPGGHRPGDGSQHLSHRFLVSGHWRRLRDKETGEVYNRVWVRPHIKGPEDGNLIIKHRTFRLKE